MVLISIAGGTFTTNNPTASLLFLAWLIILLSTELPQDKLCVTLCQLALCCCTVTV